MAKRRMFCNQVLNSGAYLDLSPMAQCLYIQLNMHADDDGFLDNVRPISRMLGASAEDLRQLVDTGFCIAFPGGVVAIAHWHAHNTVRKDRYEPTIYQEEYARLTITGAGIYKLREPEDISVKTTVETTGLPAGETPVDNLATNRQPVVATGKDRLGKVSLGKVSLGKDSLDQEGVTEDRKGVPGETPEAPASCLPDDRGGEKPVSVSAFQGEKYIQDPEDTREEPIDDWPEPYPELPEHLRTGLRNVDSTILYHYRLMQAHPELALPRKEREAYYARQTQEHACTGNSIASG